MKLFSAKLFAGRLFGGKLFRGAATSPPGPERPGDAAQAPTGSSASISASEFLKLRQVHTSAAPVVDQAFTAKRKRQRQEDELLLLGIL